LGPNLLTKKNHFPNKGLKWLISYFKSKTSINYIMFQINFVCNFCMKFCPILLHKHLSKI
jgi:hypothetical protein